MANLRNAEASISERKVTTYQGVVVEAGGSLAVNVNGKVIPARWADPLVVVAGDPVIVDITSSRRGQGEAIVRHRVAAGPRPGTGTVTTVPPSSPTITVTGSDGVAYAATFVASYTPVVGDPVILSWNAAAPSVTGKVSVSTTPENQAAAPVAAAPSVEYGATPFTATNSGTYTPSLGGWDRWAGGGTRLYQGGSAYGASGGNFGAWFYGGSPTQLAGRTITRIQFRIGARLEVGSNNSPITFHFYAHNSSVKPGGDVLRVAGPHEVGIGPHQGPATIDLPVSVFASHLLTGGGIAIAGEPYGGMNGVMQQADSGSLIMDWNR